MQRNRSLCPINLALEVIGDRWSLLIVRDLMFTPRRHFRELLCAEEGIASNVLTDRLTRLVEAGIVVRRPDPAHGAKVVYTLTEAGIDLLPVVVQLAVWGNRHRPVTAQSGAQAAALERGGEPMLEQLREKLRREHLAAPA